MAHSGPLAVRLGFALVDEGFYFARNLKEQLEVSSRQANQLVTAYDMSQPEKEFARRLLRDKRNLWLYRCHQQCFCGDFAVVDMSGTTPHERRVVVAELKERKPLEIDASPGNQLARAGDVVNQLVAADVIAASCQVVLAIGDSDELFDWLADWPR